MRPTRNPAIPDDELAKQIAEFESKGGKKKQIKAAQFARLETGESCNWRDQAAKNLERLKTGSA